MNGLRVALLTCTLALAGVQPATAAPVVEASARVEEGRSILMMLRQPPPRQRPGGGYAGGYGDAADRVLALRRARGIARAHALDVVEVWPMPVLGLECVVLRVPEGVALGVLVARLSAHPDVAWAQPLQMFETQARPPSADPLEPAQPASHAWQLSRLHRLATGRGTRVAVIDSGVDATHPDLAGRLALMRDLVGDGGGRAEAHGTAVAGIVGAAVNGVGIVGVAPEARLLALRGCREMPSGGPARCDGLALARALQLAIEQRAGVINLSLAGPADRLLAALIDAAVARGAVVVAAVGAAHPGASFPGSHPGVLGVAAEPGRGAVVAPGAGVPAPAPGGGWRLVSGSSYAAAHVSGLAALDRERGGASVRAFVRVRY